MHQAIRLCLICGAMAELERRLRDLAEPVLIEALECLQTLNLGFPTAHLFVENECRATAKGYLTADQIRGQLVYFVELNFDNIANRDVARLLRLEISNTLSAESEDAREQLSRLFLN